MPTLDDGPVSQYFAINLLRAREERGWTQEQLAARVRDAGVPCSQTTIWKLEQGQREVKLTEAVAIGRALELWSWTELTRQPSTFNVGLGVDHWRKRAYETAAATRAAATAQLEALVNLAFAVHEAQEAGLSPTWLERRSGGWLDLTPEAIVLREVLAARVGYEARDDEADRRLAEEDRILGQILEALQNSGVPLTIQPDDITDGAEPGADATAGSAAAAGAAGH